jgi:DNA-binding transcriptional MerR regulator
MSHRTTRIEKLENANHAPRYKGASAPDFTGQEVLLSIKQAAALAKRSTRTISQWAANGLLTRRVDKSGGRVYLRTELEAIIHELPHSGRPKILFSEAENKEGYMTIGEAAKIWADRVSYATFYNWIKQGLLVVIFRPGSKIRLTKRLFVLRVLRAQDKITEAEDQELTQLEIKELKKQK